MSSLRDMWLSMHRRLRRSFDFAPFRWIQSLLTVYELVAAAAIIAVWWGICKDLSMVGQSHHHFQRAGAILTLAGLICASRRLIRLDSSPAVPASTSGLALQELRDQCAARIGFVLVVAGTVIWAYGDLIC